VGRGAWGAGPDREPRRESSPTDCAGPKDNLSTAPGDSCRDTVLSRPPPRPFSRGLTDHSQVDVARVSQMRSVRVISWLSGSRGTAACTQPPPRQTPVCASRPSSAAAGAWCVSGRSPPATPARTCPRHAGGAIPWPDAVAPAPAARGDPPHRPALWAPGSGDAEMLLAQRLRVAPACRHPPRDHPGPYPDCRGPLLPFRPVPARGCSNKPNPLSWTRGLQNTLKVNRQRQLLPGYKGPPPQARNLCQVLSSLQVL
jgi:hypothetical protein